MNAETAMLCQTIKTNELQYLASLNFKASQGLLHEFEVVDEYRRRHPESRIQGILKLVKNTNATRIYGCVLCGAESPSCCNSYPVTLRVYEWCTHHHFEHLSGKIPFTSKSFK